MTKLLSGLLVFQIFLAGAMYFGNQQESDFDTDKPLLAIASTDVQKLVIQGEDSSAILEKSDSGWVLPELQGLPVNVSKVDEILEKLESAKTGWPVASSSSSHERLEVADDAFQRKISIGLESGGEKQLLMGTSPGYRSIHARVEGEDDIYNVKLAKFDFPDSHDDWLDRNLLELENVNRIKANGVEVEKVESEWQLVGAPLNTDQTQEVDSEKLKKISDLFTYLSVLGVADAAPAAEASVDVVVTNADESLTYKFFSDEDKRYVKRSDMDTVFIISKNSYDTASGVALDNILLEVSPEAEDTEDLSSNG